MSTKQSSQDTQTPRQGVSKKQKAIGNFNDIGTAQVHRRHSVSLEQIEGEPIGRAKINDQMMIDTLLMNDSIDLDQHRAAEYLMDAAFKAGMFIKTPDLTSFGGSKPKNIYNYGLVKFGEITKVLAGEITEAGSDMVVRVVCEDQPVNADELTLLRVGLDAIDRVYFGGKKPGG
mgnify:FL=1